MRVCVFVGWFLKTVGFERLSINHLLQTIWRGPLPFCKLDGTLIQKIIHESFISEDLSEFRLVFKTWKRHDEVLVREKWSRIKMIFFSRQYFLFNFDYSSKPTDDGWGTDEILDGFKYCWSWLRYFLQYTVSVEDRNTYANTDINPSHTDTHTVQENYITKTKRTNEIRKWKCRNRERGSQSRNM